MNFNAYSANIIFIDSLVRCFVQIIDTDVRFAVINPVILRFPYLEYITGYTDSKSKPLFYCNVCRHYFKRTLYNITKSKYGCPYCSRKHMNDDKKLTKVQFIKKLHSKYPNLQTLTPYKSYRTGIELICKNCDHTFKLRKTGIIFNLNYGCPFCRDGYPEKEMIIKFI